MVPLCNSHNRELSLQYCMLIKLFCLQMKYACSIFLDKFLLSITNKTPFKSTFKSIPSCIIFGSLHRSCHKNMKTRNRRSMYQCFLHHDFMKITMHRENVATEKIISYTNSIENLFDFSVAVTKYYFLRKTG